MAREIGEEGGDESFHHALTLPLIDAKDDSATYNWKQAILEELKKQVWLAGPLAAVQVLQYSLQLISLMFVGHLGELPLSGSSMATSFGAVTGMSLLMGLSSALDTLCGQSYGAKRYHMLGVHVQRAMFVLLLVCVPIAVVWANTRPILEAFGQHPNIAEEAGRYARFMIPSIFGYAILQCQNRFLQTQNIVIPMMICSGITTFIHLFSCWLLVLHSSLGNRGAAMANSISYWINVLLVALYIKFSSSCSKTWTGFSKESLHNVGIFIKLAIPSAVMVCLEAWSFEMIVLLSGLLPNPELETSVLSICLNTATLFWMIPFGLSGAVSTRVSNELGAGCPRAAKLAVGVVLGVGISESVLVGVLLLLIQNVWGYAYSNEEQVVRYVAAMMPILIVSNFLDGLQCVLSGAVRGCGRQKIGAFINLGSYYIVGIPMAALLAFVLHVGGKGLWWGIICALVMQVMGLLTIIIRNDWEQQVKKAQERVNDAAILEEMLS